MQIIETGRKVYASLIRPGMVIRTEAGERVEVYEITEGYSTWALSNGIRATTVQYGELVEVLGYFNI